ncbi:hypothetical protein CRUP_038107 [Coryphaenoides rupestris]|nr:hypothetical protein CRUP_038107 [Coryphaenoides rupestris]
MEKIYIRHVELLGFEKRLFPSQHYKTLKEMFPIESGAIEKKDRTIPSLAAPSWLDSQKATATRQSPLAEYCRSLVNLPPHISRCLLVCNFFAVRPEDENPPAPNTTKRSETTVMSKDKLKGTISEITGPIVLDTYRAIGDYDKTSKHEITLHTGDLVEIVEKSTNGEKALAGGSASVKLSRAGFQPPTLSLWTPQTSLRKPNPTTQAREQYVTTTAYQAEQEDEVSLEVGEEVAVIHKLLDGWWVVRIHSRGRQRLSQEAYRRNSRRFLQTTRGHLTEGGRKPPLRERMNQANIPEKLESTLEPKSPTPAIPLRPSSDLIIQRCTEQTRKKVSVRKPSDSAKLS